jgi:hypothetical protein
VDEQLEADAAPEPSPPTPAEELAAAVAEREQAERVVLLRARALREALANLDLPRRVVADALERLTEGDEELEAAEQQERALRAAMGPAEQTEEQWVRARVVAMADAADARAA